MAKPCAHCGADHAPYGLRLPGLASSLPQKYQIPVPFCARAECRAAVYARREAFMEKIGAGLKARAAPKPDNPADPAQGVLL